MRYIALHPWLSIQVPNLLVTKNPVKQVLFPVRKQEPKEAISLPRVMETVKDTIDVNCVI